MVTKALTKLLDLTYTIFYKKGVENKAADALSRRPHTAKEMLHELHRISSVQPLWLEDIIPSYVDDPFSAALFQRLALNPQSDKKFSLRASILHIDQCICVGNRPQLHHKLVCAFHDSAIGGHSSFPVTYKRIKQMFRWMGMRGDVKKHVQHCITCQQAKPERYLILDCYSHYLSLLCLGK